jgi:hypothetical protein
VTFALEVREAESREACNALAGARFADYPEGLTTMDLEGEAVDGLDEPVGSGEMHVEVFDFQQDLAALGHRRIICRCLRPR